MDIGCRLLSVELTVEGIMGQLNDCLLHSLASLSHTLRRYCLRIRVPMQLKTGSKLLCCIELLICTYMYIPSQEGVLPDTVNPVIHGLCLFLWVCYAVNHLQGGRIVFNGDFLKSASQMINLIMPNPVTSHHWFDSRLHA